MRADAWIDSAEARLAAGGIADARLESRLLAAHALGRDRSWILAHPEADLPPSADAALARRLAREPLAYILGGREFYGRWFEVGPGALVPRPETETLVKAALERDWASALDVGTGSGCLAVTLALERPDATVCGSDLEPGALRWAGGNAARLGARVEFRLGDLFAPWAGRRFDLIVSNPPYVAPGAALDPEIADHEPPTALYAPDEGFAVYQRLAEEGAACLAPEGCVIVELGDGMRPETERRFAAAGWCVVACHADLLGTPRALVLARPDGGAGPAII